MIYPIDYRTRPNLGVVNPDKDLIVAFMHSVSEPSGICEGYVRDLADGSSVRVVDCEFKAFDLAWYEEDTYNFEHNDMELNPEFCERVLEIVRSGKTQP